MPDDHPQFACFLEPARAGMPSAPTIEEAAGIEEHFAYYQRLLSEGVLVFAGRTTTPPFTGVLVFRASDESAARRIVEADPAIARGVFRCRLQPFRTALVGNPHT